MKPVCRVCGSLGNFFGYGRSHQAKSQDSRPKHAIAWDEIADSRHQTRAVQVLKCLHFA